MDWHEALSHLDIGTQILLGTTLVGIVAIIFEVSWIVLTATLNRTTHGAKVLRSLGVGTVMFLVSTVMAVAYGSVLRVAWAALHRISPSGLARLWEKLPLVAAIVCFVTWDATGFLYHWLGHRFRIGWAAHSPHHSGAAFDITVGLRQTWLPIFALPVQASVALLGFDLRLVASVAAISNIVQLLQHSSLLRLPRFLEAVVVGPGTHRLHHEYGTVNLGPVFTIWDHLAGTWMRVPVLSGQIVSGTRSHVAVRENPFVIEVAGWVGLFRSVLSESTLRGITRNRQLRRTP
jgi:sterol desaturase/sphingolipid hydroxylase (fatty acid hydroxylase superfamily)